MYIVKFDPNVLNFGYDFFLLVPFLGHPVDCHEESLNWTTKLIWSQDRRSNSEEEFQFDKKYEVRIENHL